jgi:site-specific DNA recombinase
VRFITGGSGSRGARGILDRETFDRVQQLLSENHIRRGTKYSESGALLKGKLFDDKGNLMGPSFSSKNGVRYRFYVSTALRGRKHKAGSVARISAPEIETLVEAALRKKFNDDEMAIDDLFGRIRRVTVSTSRIQIFLDDVKSAKRSIDIPWEPKSKDQAQVRATPSDTKTDLKLIKALARAHAWRNQLVEGRYASIEQLAAAADYNPKVIRQGLRLAFLSPDIAEAAIQGAAPFSLKQIPKLLPLSWREQHQSLG